MTQQNSNVLVWAGIVLAIALSIVGIVFHGGSSSLAAGGTTTQTGLSSWVGNPPSAAYPGNGVESDLGFFDTSSGVSNFLGTLSFSNNTTTAGPTYKGAAGTCNTATSTLFSYTPTATGTVAVIIPAIGGNATTSSLLVGTSTKSSGLVSTDVSATLINSSNGVATSSVLAAASGMNVGEPGFIAAGSASVMFIPVSPTQRVVAYSTTTATGAGAAGYVPGFSTCSYKILQLY